ncbi:MAG: phenylacetate--CoA ligase [Clostridia bacterium]|nr:phenylacetate--CoA ligase [Clostridia bacterium]
MIYSKAETLTREEMSELQSKRLREQVKRVYENVAPYRKHMDECGITPDDIHGIEDLHKLPFTVKQDLRDSYPFGLFATPMSEVVRIHASSGTTGKKTVVGYTAADLDLWAEVMARTLSAAGVTKDDVVQVAYGYGLFTGGLGANNGSEKLGASTVPASTGNTNLQIDLMRDFGVNAICCTPSFALYLAETIEKKGIDPKSLKLRTGCFGAEPWTENMRREIEARLDIKAHDIYGLSEIIGPGVAFECEEQDGLHINEDHFIPEIIDPDTGEVLPDGEYGELVFTCITKEAMPLIRYRTRDVACISHGTCACGRTLVKMGKPKGRTDDMLIIRGVNVFPSQVESALLELDETAPHYQLIVDRKGALDTLDVMVEMNESMFADTVKKVEEVEERIRRAIQNVLGIAVNVHLVNPNTIQRSEGKAVRVIDKRKLV